MKSISFRRLALGLVFGVTLGCLVGCSNSGASRSPQEPPTPGAAALLADSYFAAAVANAMDRIVAGDRTFDVDPERGFSRSGTSGMLLPGSDAFSGSGEAVTSQSWARGGHVTSSVPWRGEGQLEFYVEVTPYAQEENGILTTRYVDTSYQRGTFEDFTTSGAAIENHGLGAEWQGLQATNDYRDGGALTVRLYTDVDDSDRLDRPWANEVFERPAARRDIALHDLPPLPASQDWRSIPIPQEGLAGSLDGIEGRFSCPSAEGCSLDNERLPPDWEGYHMGYDNSNVVIFTPAGGGTPVHFSGARSRPVPAGDYLTFGNWLYAPADAADVEAYEVGVFAAGRDPFNKSTLMALAGTAAFTGKAAGLYAAAARPVTGTFTADVALTAEFGTGSDLGAVSGWVSGFALDDGEPSPITELRLLPASIRTSDLDNSASPPAEPLPGGWIQAETAAAGGWHGVWGGRFFGNGSGAEQPSSFAGTFGATDGNHRFAAGFGAHRTDR